MATKIYPVESGGAPIPTTVSSPRSVSGSTLSGVALTHWPAKVCFITYKKDATDSTKIDLSTLCAWTGSVSGTTVSSLVLTAGTDAGNAVCDFMEVAPTDKWGQGVYDAFITEHADDGTHDATKVGMLAGTQTFTGNKTFSGTVTLPTNSITASELATSAITLGYAQITSNFTGAATAAVQAVTGLTNTVTIPSGGRKVKITVFVKDVFISTGGAAITLSLWDGTVGSGTKLAEAATSATSVSTAYSLGPLLAVITPAAGSKTYNVGIQSNSAANAPNIDATATAPAFILVEAI